MPLQFNVYSLVPAAPEKPPKATLLAGFVSRSDADQYLARQREAYGKLVTLMAVDGTIESSLAGLHV